MDLLELKHYIENIYEGDLKTDLLKYIGSNELSEDVDRIMYNDDTISMAFALQCAVDQKAEYLLND